MPGFARIALRKIKEREAQDSAAADKVVGSKAPVRGGGYHGRCSAKAFRSYDELIASQKAVTPGSVGRG